MLSMNSKMSLCSPSAYSYWTISFRLRIIQTTCIIPFSFFYHCKNSYRSCCLCFIIFFFFINQTVEKFNQNFAYVHVCKTLIIYFQHKIKHIKFRKNHINLQHIDLCSRNTIIYSFYENRITIQNEKACKKHDKYIVGNTK